MAIGNVLVAQFKADLFLALHNFASSTGHTFKMGLYKAAASTTGANDKTFQVYSDITGNSDELATGSGYTAGGKTCTNAGNGTDTGPGNNIGYGGFSGSIAWTSATFTTGGVFIYNTSSSNKLVLIQTFSSDQTVTSGTLTVTFPTFNSTQAIIRIN
jgi:hypothetical protein